ncbi:hypothetical protein CB1_000286011 [Camelus ferus]|nr:hypothetical protein CB1_000286011 [Camelus ferus]
MKLMADSYEDDHFKPSPSSQANHKPSPDQVFDGVFTAVAAASRLAFPSADERPSWVSLKRSCRGASREKEPVDLLPGISGHVLCYFLRCLQGREVPSVHPPSSTWPPLHSQCLIQKKIIQPLLELDQNRSKLKLYIGHLTALCHDRDPLILRGLTPPASYNLDDDQAAWESELQKMTREQLQDELEKGERDNAELQEFANAVLQQIADHCPDILEQVVNALEESS